MSENKYTTNNNHTLVAVSSADDETPVYLRADPVSKTLLMGGLTAGVSYDYLDVQQTSATAASLDVPFTTPEVVESARFLHVILNMPIGTATASQVIRGQVMVRGRFV